MPTTAEIMKLLEKAGSEQTRKIFANHGEPAGKLFGVKVADLKTIAKKIKGEQKLAMDLYATGNLDAMYLAGIVADGSKMSKKELDTWASQAEWHMVGEYSVPGVASENKDGYELALKWIAAKKEHVASSGWATLSAWVSVKDDSELDLKKIESLLGEVEKKVHSAPNRVRYTMNSFVIAVGGYVKPLLKKAQATAKKIGKVSVDMGGTACKVPVATEYIAKIESMDRVGKKRKTARC